MKYKEIICKFISVLLMALIVWTFMIFLPHEEIRQLGLYLGTQPAYAGEVYAGPSYSPPPRPTDLSDPGVLKFSWARKAGREDAIYMNIPSNQLSGRIQLPSSPSPMILAKYDPEGRVGTLALMRMQKAGPSIKAELVQLTPRNFHHFMGKAFYNFAWLDFNYNTPGCDISEKALSLANPPAVDNSRIIHDLGEYDKGKTSIPPLYILGMEEAKINKSSYYWHQRLNNDPCFTHISFSTYDGGDGNWHNVSQTGFYNLVAFAQQIHKAGASFIATPNIRTDVKQESHSDFFTKTTKTTVSYYLKPDWTVCTRANRGSYSDILVNPTGIPQNDVSCIMVQGKHTFPADEVLLHQWTKTDSGLTGLFVFVAIVALIVITVISLATLAPESLEAIGALVGATATLEAGAAIVATVGALGALAASGFSPTTSTTADITPFYDSSYDFSQPDLSGDQATVEQRTQSMWLNVPDDSTPGGYSQFITGIDFRKALACGGASHTPGCNASAITQIGMDDPRFQQVYNEMFINPTKDLQQYKYPFTQR